MCIEKTNLRTVKELNIQFGGRHSKKVGNLVALNHFRGDLNKLPFYTEITSNRRSIFFAIRDLLL